MSFSLLVKYIAKHFEQYQTLTIYCRNVLNIKTNTFGDYLIYFIPKRFNFRTFRWMQTMIFAIEEINRDRQLLANLTMGYKIYDSCSTHFHALRTALALMNGNKEGTGISECRGRVPVVIGDGGSTLSLVVARFLGVFHVPQVSCEFLMRLWRCIHVFESYTLCSLLSSPLSR